MKKFNTQIRFTKEQKLKAIRKADRELFLKDRVGVVLVTKIAKNKKKYTRKSKHKYAI